jgi:phosphoribosylaminoimidazole carboxylase / phosphoribosylaminoimidazole-succinocarboxamide synthase
MQKILNEGKTKRIKEYEDNTDFAVLESKDDITAGDGAKHAVMDQKAQWATQTTCNVFRLLKVCGVPVAFHEQLDKTRFVAQYCQMIPYEVVVRREAHGSFLKRNPHLQKGTVFPHLICEFFLKTANKTWEDTTIPEDDPFMQRTADSAQLFLPKKPLWEQEPFLTLDEYPLKDDQTRFEQMETIAKQTFLILEKAWQQVGKKLVDFKVEFGFDAKGNLLLADVIDNDSWRVLDDNQYLDKQLYRDGANLDEVASKYFKVAELTKQFMLPKQRIILWRASERDDIAAFEKELAPFLSDDLKLKVVTKSLHKEPTASCNILNKLVAETPNSVIIAFVGRSNGAGPTLSANTSVPVITVPNGWKNFEQDVWSSLRTPSLTPVMTVLEPSNAVLAALQILGMNNPRVYTQLRAEHEKRLVNYVSLDTTLFERHSG